MLRLFVSISVVLITLTACTPNPSYRQGIDPLPQNRASHAITDSFAVLEQPVSAKEKAIGLDRYLISINRNALEKEFLLHAELITQLSAPQFSGLKSRVVFFKQRGDSLYLLEATDGQAYQKDIPQNFLLAEFKIIQEREGQLIFDFNKGMSQVFVASDWNAVEEESGTTYTPHFETADIRISFLEDASLANNRLYIRQVAQIREMQDKPGSEEKQLTSVPMEVRYYVSPYEPDATFAPFVHTEMKNFGFFTVAAQIKDGQDGTVYASKWHQSKPIVFAISANTPADYREAVRQGILYWNRILGREQIQVIIAPEGVSAPHPDYNIVQWVNWDTAGYAFADAQMDPRSGQILHAQIYMTSVWAISSVEAAKKYLEDYKRDKSKIHEHHKSYSLKGFESNHLCLREMKSQFAQVLETAINAGADDQRILQIAQDQVMITVVHELGHAMGLRHNFAGSLMATYDLKDWREIAKKYVLRNEFDPKMIFSTTVMDYNIFIDSCIMAQQILTENMPYDKSAIGVLYNGGNAEDTSAGYFCSDNDVAKYADCKPYDIGNTITGYSPYLKDQTLAKVRTSIITAIEPLIKAQTPENIPSRMMDAEAIAGASYWMQDIHITKTFTNEEGILMARAGEEVEGKEAKNLDLAFLEEDFAKNGGMMKVLAPLSLSFVDEQVAAFKTELERRQLTVSDVILNFAKKYYRGLQQVLVKADVKLSRGILDQEGAIIEKSQVLVDHPLSNEYAKVLKEKINVYTFAQSTETINAEIGGTKYALPKFIFPFEIRREILLSLNPDRASSLIWGIYEREDVKRQLMGLLATVLPGRNVMELKPTDYSAEVAEWIIQMQLLVRTLEQKWQYK